MKTTGRWLTLVIVALGYWLRVHHLGLKSLWYDELRQVEAAQLPLDRMTAAAQAFHAGRPLDYLITHALLKWNRGETILRFPAAVFGALTIAVGYRLGRRWLGQAEGALGAGLLAFSALHVGLSQEVRPYALFALLTAGSYVFLEAGLHGARRGAWPGYAACTSLAVLTHFFALGMLGGQVIYAIGALAARPRSARHIVAPFTLSLAAAVLSLALTTVNPSGLVALGSAFAGALVTRGGLAPEVRNVYAPALTWDFLANRVLAGLGAGGGAALFVFTGLALIGAAGSVPRRAAWPLLTWLVVGPSIVVLYLYYRGGIYGVRHILFALPAFLLLVAHGITTMGRSLAVRFTLPVGHVAFALIALASLALDARRLSEYYRTPKDDWRRVARFLAANVQPGDVIVAPDVQAFIRFYWRESDAYLVGSDEIGAAQYAFADSNRAWFVLSVLTLRDTTPTRDWVSSLPGVRFDLDPLIPVTFARQGQSIAQMQAEAASFVVPPPGLPNALPECRSSDGISCSLP